VIGPGRLRGGRCGHRQAAGAVPSGIRAHRPDNPQGHGRPGTFFLAPASNRLG